MFSFPLISFYVYINLFYQPTPYRQYCPPYTTLLGKGQKPKYIIYKQSLALDPLTRVKLALDVTIWSLVITRILNRSGKISRNPITDHNRVSVVN